MKYLILLGDGMADYPLKELGGKTPLQAAKTPHLDFIAQKGIIGRVSTIPPGFHPGSDVANLAVLGYNPGRYYTGRAPLEAAGMGIKLGEKDVAFRCNLVTLKFHPGRILMEDFSAGHISTPEGESLLLSLEKCLGSEEIKFYPGVSYRHLMVWHDGLSQIKTTPPHDIGGQDIGTYLPEGKGKEKIIQLMNDSRKIFEKHEVNIKRVEKSQSPANSVWLWGQGKSPSLPSFYEKYRLKGTVISAVDLIKGIGVLAGLKPIDVPGATGYLDTNYEGKAKYALKELQEKDLAYIHVEAPDEAAHSGDIKAKIQAIQDFDHKVVKTILEGSEFFQNFRILALPDHATPISLRTHTADPVPFAMCSSEDIKLSSSSVRFDESSASASRIFVENGYELMDFFIKGKEGSPRFGFREKAKQGISGRQTDHQSQESGK